MPRYQVQHPDGRKITIEGDSPPTDEDLDNIFASIPSKSNPISERALSFSVGGIVPAVGGAKNIEEQLPMIHQGIASAVPGLNALTGGVLATEAATLGQAERQGIRSLRGKGFDPYALGKEAIGTGLTEGFMRGIPTFYFRNQLGGETKQLIGKQIGKIVEGVKQKTPFANMAKVPIVQDVERALKSNPFERGPAVQALANVKKKLVGIPRPLNFDEARQLEQQLGREAIFVPKTTQGHFAKAPKAPGLNQALKELRNKISKNVDAIASIAGYPEYADFSNQYTDLMKKFPEEKLQKGITVKPFLLKSLALGGGLGSALLHHPAVGIPMGMMSTLSMIPQNVRTALFRNFLNRPIGQALSTASRMGTSEGIRRLLNQ